MKFTLSIFFVHVLVLFILNLLKNKLDSLVCGSEFDPALLLLCEMYNVFIHM